MKLFTYSMTPQKMLYFALFISALFVSCKVRDKEQYIRLGYSEIKVKGIIVDRCSSAIIVKTRVGYIPICNYTGTRRLNDSINAIAIKTKYQNEFINELPTGNPKDELPKNLEEIATK